MNSLQEDLELLKGVDDGDGEDLAFSDGEVDDESKNEVTSVNILYVPFTCTQFEYFNVLFKLGLLLFGLVGYLEYSEMSIIY